DALAQERQHLAEVQHVAELRVVARVAVRGVVAVLLAAARVARRGLDVAVGIGADPHLGPGRRDGERIDSSSLPSVRDAAAVGQVVSPARADALARDAARAVGDIAQPGARRRRAPMLDPGAPVLASWAARIPAHLVARIPA